MIRGADYYSLNLVRGDIPRVIELKNVVSARERGSTSDELKKAFTGEHMPSREFVLHPTLNLYVLKE